MFGWYFVGCHLIIAAQGFSVFSGFLSGYLDTSLSVHIPWWVLSMICVVYTLGFSFRGISISAEVALFLLAGEVLVLIALAVWLLISGHAHLTLSVFNPNSSPGGWAAIGLAISLGIVGLAGFEEAATRIAAVTARYPWLVAELDGAVAGYAYAGPHRERASYRWSADVTVYVSAAHHRRGVGRALYTLLFALLAQQGYYEACAGITLPNDASVALHESLGFRAVGVYREIAFKFRSWRDVGWWQKTHFGQGQSEGVFPAALWRGVSEEFVERDGEVSDTDAGGVVDGVCDCGGVPTIPISPMPLAPIGPKHTSRSLSQWTSIEAMSALAAMW